MEGVKNMLEAIHLTKVYKTKGGADTKALDDVSIVFPEKGMVFLLGKVVAVNQHSLMCVVD